MSPQTFEQMSPQKFLNWISFCWYYSWHADRVVTCWYFFLIYMALKHNMLISACRHLLLIFWRRWRSVAVFTRQTEHLHTNHSITIHDQKVIKIGSMLSHIEHLHTSHSISIHDQQVIKIAGSKVSHIGFLNSCIARLNKHVSCSWMHVRILDYSFHHSYAAYGIHPSFENESAWRVIWPQQGSIQ